jgi:ribulose-5-phosphate 4-epimerase/fuculose-1-phosphate aldolase
LQLADESRSTPNSSIYDPTQEGLIYPRKPQFSSLKEERQHRKERLASACRLFARKDFSFGFGGHLTVRDPEHPELFWTNPMSVPFAHVKVSNLILVNEEGDVVEGEYAVNRAGYVLHSAIHALNPDIVASCHAHTIHGGAWASMGRPLDPISQDACMFYGDHVVLADGAGKVPVSSSSGHPVAEAFKNNKAVIHQNHGLLTASRDSIDAAAWWFYALDHCCRMQMLSDNLRTPPKEVSRENAEYTAKHLGTGYMGWLMYQTEYAEILKAEPDFLD